MTGVSARASLRTCSSPNPRPRGQSRLFAEGSLGSRNRRASRASRSARPGREERLRRRCLSRRRRASALPRFRSSGARPRGPALGRRGARTSWPVPVPRWRSTRSRLFGREGLSRRYAKARKPLALRPAAVWIPIGQTRASGSLSQLTSASTRRASARSASIASSSRPTRLARRCPAPTAPRTSWSAPTRKVEATTGGRPSPRSSPAGGARPASASSASSAC
jgi:hypothetical protein